ncbi:hypothetical protein ABPG72_009177 [Tetrahymena utriculariae]
MVSAWSIPKARRQSLSSSNKLNPGPGTYSPENTNRSHNISLTQSPLSLYKNNPAFSIGKEKRQSFVSGIGPGSGKYQIENKFQFKTSPKYSFGLKTSTNFNNSSITPSPNTYNSNDQYVSRKSPTYSIGVSREQSPTDLFRKLKIMTPGPGQYDQQSTLNSTMGKTFGREKRINTLPDTPGPGTYDNNKFIAYLENPPQYSFGSEKRTQTFESSTPAPGTYEIDKSTMIKVGGFISKNGRCQIDCSQTPGPGKYSFDISSIKRKSENPVFGKSLRSSPTRNDSPGPNEYEMPPIDIYKKRTSNNTIFGQSDRPRLSSIGNPGPGQYKEKPMWNTGIEFTMSGRKNDLNLNNTPGPAFYDPNIKPIKIQTQNILFGKSKRDSPECRLYNTSQAPGPGNYQILNNSVIKQDPKFSFTKARRGSIKSQNITPGPADYKIPPIFADVPKYLLNNVNN